MGGYLSLLAPDSFQKFLVSRNRYLYTVSREFSQGMKEEHHGQNLLVDGFQVASNDAGIMLLLEMPLF